MMTSDDVAALNNKRMEELTEVARVLVKVEERRIQKEDSVSNKLEILIDRIADVAKNLHDLVESLPE